MLRLEFKGADELAADMKVLIEESPKELLNALFNVAEKFNNDVNVKMPGKYKDRIKKWNVRGAIGTNGPFVTSTNKAPHFHLVENGHAKYAFHGRFTGGFVPGRHYAEQTRQEYQEKYPELMLDEISYLLTRRFFRR